MSSLRRLVVIALGSAALAVQVRPAAAQVDYEVMASLQFNFSNPGARSLAMAGALTGAGDDATGAWTNPGGLTNITRPEVGVELRGFGFRTPFVSGGRFNGAPSNRGVDTISGLVFGASDLSTNSLSFVSAVVPRSRFAFAVYRTEVANYRSEMSTEGPFFDDPVFGRLRAFPIDATLETQISNIGGAAAVRLSDAVSVGVGVSVYDFELQAESFRFGAFGTFNTAPGGFLGPPVRDRRLYFSGGNTVSHEQVTGDDRAVGLNVGVSVTPNERIRFGASFRQGASFDVRHGRNTLGDDGFEFVEGAGQLGVPDVFGVGVLVKPIAALNVTVDVRRIQYSQLIENMDAGYFGDPDDYVVDDGTEVRAAAEYLFTDLASPLSAIAIRGGVWRDPDHRIRYEGPFGNDTVVFPRGETQMHYTGGAGIVFERFQFDVGYDRAEQVKTFSVSAIVRF